jgi:hypothetical protein
MPTNVEVGIVAETYLLGDIFLYVIKQLHF